MATKNKRWIIENGVLAYENGNEINIPSVHEIYSSVFEDLFSENVTKDDAIVLKDKLYFSEFPVDLYISLEPSAENTGIELNIYATINDGGRAKVFFKQNVEHIVIENTWYPFAPGAMDDISQIMNEVGISSPGKINFSQYLSLAKLSDDIVQNNVRPDNIILGQVQDEKPAALKATLYPYQIKGWRWLSFMKEERIGGILADEMGLGKTIQVIALLSNEPKENSFPALIIAPTTLLENWRREFAKFAPQIATHIHQGAQRTGFPSELKNYNVTITSYDTVVRDNSLFGQINWKVVICDEAQAIKNPLTKRSISVKRIPRLSGFAVTGTPIENSLTDLWSIIDFSVPGFLGDKVQFESLYGTTPDGPSRLEKVISPLILRRRVNEVAKDLPSKIVIPQVLELSSGEVAEYERIREDTIYEFESNSSLVVLTRLRVFCTHPFLLCDRPGEDPAQYSNKYSRLVEIVEEIAENGAKVLVFTSFNKMNDILVSDLNSRFGVKTFSIDGRTNTSERQQVVDQFSNTEGAAVLVLNPIAAGAGLNITAANHVIHYNLEWNPAKEDQASARAYRRGQDRPVTIHRLFYANTVEEAIDERLIRKREIAGAAIVGVQGEQDDYNDIFNAIQKSPKRK